MEQDLEVPADTIIEGNLVVAGRCWLGKGVRVNGSLKVHRELTLAEGVVITGAMVCRNLIKVGAGAWVRGPIISEEHLDVGAGAESEVPPSQRRSRPGRSPWPRGTVICGQIMGEEGGQTT